MYKQIWKSDNSTLCSTNVGSVWSNTVANTLTPNLTRPDQIADLTWRLVSNCYMQSPTDLIDDFITAVCWSVFTEMDISTR